MDEVDQWEERNAKWQSRLVEIAEYRRRRAVSKAIDLKSDKDAAWLAMQWASGKTQAELASQYGYMSPPPISSAIERFMRKYTPNVDALVCFHAERRKAHVKDAVVAFRAHLMSAD